MGFRPDFSTMFLNQPFCNGKPQAYTTMFPTLNLVEFFEDPFNFILRNTNPCVLNLVEDVFVFSAGDDLDLASIRSKLEGVEEEIDEDIMKPMSVSIDREILWNINQYGEVFIHRFDLINISFDHFRKKDGFSG